MRSDVWPWVILSSPLLGALVAAASAKHLSRPTAIVAGFCAGLSCAVLPNLLRADGDELGLVLLVSIPYLPFLIVGAFLGAAVGRRR